jgi:hypothetical protein
MLGRPEYPTCSCTLHGVWKGRCTGKRTYLSCECSDGLGNFGHMDVGGPPAFILGVARSSSDSSRGLKGRLGVPQPFRPCFASRRRDKKRLIITVIPRLGVLGGACVTRLL